MPFYLYGMIVIRNSSHAIYHQALLNSTAYTISHSSPINYTLSNPQNALHTLWAADYEHDLKGVDIRHVSLEISLSSRDMFAHYHTKLSQR